MCGGLLERLLLPFIELMGELWLMLSRLCPSRLSERGNNGVLRMCLRALPVPTGAGRMEEFDRLVEPDQFGVDVQVAEILEPALDEPALVGVHKIEPAISVEREAAIAARILFCSWCK